MAKIEGLEKPTDWSDEEWAKYLEWKSKLPGYDPGRDVINAVIIGQLRPSPSPYFWNSPASEHPGLAEAAHMRFLWIKGFWGS